MALTHSQELSRLEAEYRAQFSEFDPVDQSIMVALTNFGIDTSPKSCWVGGLHYGAHYDAAKAESMIARLALLRELHDEDKPKTFHTWFARVFAVAKFLPQQLFPTGSPHWARLAALFEKNAPPWYKP